MSLAPSISPSAEIKITRGHSCVLCRRRKIKCDGQHPCQNCVKARAECTAPEVVPARRRKRKQEDIAARLRRCEDIISKAGLKIEDDEEEVDAVELWSERSMSRSVRDGGESREAEGGKLIVEKGSSRYIESSIWENIDTEVREDSIHMLQQSSEDDTTDQISAVSDYSSLLFGRLMVSNSLTASHPPPVHIFRLWQTFIDNINPLTKLLHAPTVQQVILQASGDLDKVSASTEALMFAIYHAAAVSLDNQECQNMLGDSRANVLAKYSTATQQALVNAKVLRTSNLMVLQAMTLYLLSIRQFTDSDTMWVLSGIATRIGQRMGLHSASTTPQLSILEREIRGRLWWQILTLEGHSSSISGSASPSSIISFRPSHILNVNDSDLTPTMREPPLEHHAITEMLFCCIRYEIGLFMFTSLFYGEPSANPAPTPSDSITAKIQAVDELEARLQSKYIRYVDPSVPLHFLASLVVRSALCKIRLRIYAPPRRANSPPQPQAERDAAFALSVTMLEFDNEGHSASAQAKLKGFMWHVRVFFQIEAFIYVLSELRVRTTGKQVDCAWRLVEAVYSHHENILRETKNKLWFAVGNLCLKAWEQRVKGLRGLQGLQGVQNLGRPSCVQELYAQRGVKGRLDIDSGGVELAMGIEFPGQTDVQMLQDSRGVALGGQWDATLPSTNMQFDTGSMGSMDWEYWQTLFDDYGVPLFGGSE